LSILEWLRHVCNVSRDRSSGEAGGGGLKPPTAAKPMEPPLKPLLIFFSVMAVLRTLRSSQAGALNPVGRLKKTALQLAAVTWAIGQPFLYSLNRPIFQPNKIRPFSKAQQVTNSLQLSKCLSEEGSRGGGGGGNSSIRCLCKKPIPKYPIYVKLRTKF
jgi:hypothetical protein